MDEAKAVMLLVHTLRPFQQRVTENDFDQDEAVRRIVRAALRELGVYDAHGCPLCLS